ncbi:glycosyltransferase family 1 protein [Jeotgalibacillus sp. S-D1]|uniref:glycosyltransferase family 1 protein n=1 Tax=Jeotgalibacillus sp. S-D1 TaxID=2552189 RepID=UPI00105A05EE|nr:glycosyltransferase family 1 protein [Jeotgalibacillus sp. S-D1]TDL31825.1 glycosyltransferase family 1 protein [Jeotgalibacillus sp. S-D1]
MDGPLRVLHVVVNMNRGGAETLIMNLYRNIDRTKIQFDFLTCYEGVFDEEIKQLGGKIHRIPYVTTSGHRTYIKNLNQFFTHHPYKIVHSHMDKMSGFVLRAAARAMIPVRIAHSHNTSSEGGLLIKTYKWMAGKNIPKYATAYYACSTKAASWLFEKESSRSHILKNGIECDQYMYSPAKREKMRKLFHLQDGDLVIGHVGRFNQQKNHSFLLEVFAEVVQIVPDAHLFLVGGGALQHSIEKKVQDLKISKNVHMLGIRDDIHLVMQAFDVFAFPSLHEGLPVTLIEAQCAGIPCVISETISDEADLECGLISALPITNKKIWVEALLNIRAQQPSRIKTEKIVSEQGYNIRQTAVHTQNAYLELGGVGS